MSHHTIPLGFIPALKSGLKRMAIAVCAAALWTALPSLSVPGYPNFSEATLFSEALAQTASAQDEALFLAIENNDLASVKIAVTNGASIDARDFNGMQPVDLAIDRDYFDIAHYLISAKNGTAPIKSAASKATPPKVATPTQEIAAAPAETPPPEVLDAPAPDLFSLEPPTSDPAKTPEKDVQAPEVVDVKPEATPQPDPLVLKTPDETPAPEVVEVKPEPAPPPKAELRNAQTQTYNEVKRIDTTKMSASKRFVTTFMDFFKPANVTGIMRKSTKKVDDSAQPLTADQLNAQLQSLEAELGPALHRAQQTPAQARAALRSNRIARARADKDAQQHPSATNPDTASPQASTSDQTSSPSKSKWGNAPINKNLPFDGQVDPEILAYLDGGNLQKDSAAPGNDAFALGDGGTSQTDTPTTAEADPFALPSDTPVADDPFAPPSETPEAADPFALDNPQDVATLETKKPPSRQAAEADPFAEVSPPAANDPFADASAPTANDPFADSGGVLEGLLDTANSSGGWDVKKVEGGTIPNEVQALDTYEATGNMLEGVELTLGADTIIGQGVGKQRLKLMSENTIHRPCLHKGGKETMFCVDKVSWPFELEEDFLVDTIMYQGTGTVSRYDAGRATNFHALFRSTAFPRVIAYYIKRFGQPSEIVQRAVAPLAKPRMDNPTYIWRSREAGTDTTTSLEIRKFDDARGSFPDTRRGVIMLYRSHAGPIFPQLSQLELMVLKSAGQSESYGGAALKNEAVW